MTFKHKLVTAASAGSILAATLLPSAAFASTTVDVNNTGADSVNKVDISNVNKTTVEQKNVTNVTTVVTASANTGGNSVSKNTGGDSSVETGKASNSVSVGVGGSSNTADVAPCGCDEDTDVTVEKTGADSKNKVNVKNKNKLSVKQKNYTTVTTVATLKANTGKNKVKKNTGEGSSVKTDDADNMVEVGVEGGDNTL